MKFNLNDYETVEQRIKRLYETHEDARIITEWVNPYDEDANSPRTWVVKAYVYLTAGDQANKLPKATGYAFERDGTGGANNTSAMENAETSAIGRALANMNLSGNKRTSREEMEKVQRGQRDFIEEADRITDVESLRLLYAQAKAQGAPLEVLEKVKARGESLSNQDSGAGAGVSGGAKGRGQR